MSYNPKRKAGTIPPFDSDGLLPAGDHEVSFDELRESTLVLGPAGSETWDARWRAKLVDNLEILTQELWRVGITEVFVDGSFVEEKDHPNDIDGYFVCDLHLLSSGRLERELNNLGSARIWTWDPALRRPYRGYPKQQLPMWHRYRVEFYPHVPGLEARTGIRDRHGNELGFPSAFRQSRDGKRRGIVKILPEVTP